MVPRRRFIFYLFLAINGSVVLIHLPAYVANVNDPLEHYKQLQPSGQRMCMKPETNVFFVNMPEVGAESLWCILYRHGINNRLTMPVLPMELVDDTFNSSDLYKIMVPIYKPKISPKYNIFGDNLIYNRTVLQRDLIANPRTSVVLVRDPKAVFQTEVLHQDELRALRQPDAIDEFFRLKDTRDMYDSRFRNPLCKRLGINENIDIYSYGREFEYHVNEITKEFVVLLAENYTLSLVLLRRALCWPVKDFIHTFIPPSSGQLSEDVDWDAVCDWSNCDCALYEELKSVFHEDIQNLGPDIYEEESAFKQISDTISEFCKEKGDDEAIHFPRTKWFEGFVFSRDDCGVIDLYPQEIRPIYHLLQTYECTEPTRLTGHLPVKLRKALCKSTKNIPGMWNLLTVK